MDRAARRPMLAFATLTAAGALALTPITVTPNAPSLSSLSSLSEARVSTQAVQLADAWTDLVAHTIDSVVGLTTTFLGADNSYPLPPVSFPLAPVVTQVVLNQVAYLAQLINGQGGQIPGEIVTHLDAMITLAAQVLTALPGVVGEQLKAPFVAVQQAIASIAAAPSPLAGLLYAPAVFLDYALNSPAGLLGPVGPFGFGLIIRNVLTTAIYTPIPPITLPFKKAAPAAATPKPAATTVASTVASPSGTAGSARSKPKPPAGSSKKASSTKTTSKAGGAGSGHGKRG